MPRGAEQSAIQNAGTGQQNAASLMSAANPQGVAASKFFTNELNNPQGYSPQDLAGMLTNSNQSLGGSNAGAVGSGNLLAARTGNNAGLATALGSANRNNAKIASGNALDVAGQNAALKQKQMQGGATGLESLYGTNLGESLKSLGLSNEAIAQWINGANSTSKDINQNIQTGIQTAELASGGSAGGGKLGNGSFGG